MSLFRFLESPTMSSTVRVEGYLQSCLPEPWEILSHSFDPNADSSEIPMLPSLMIETSETARLTSRQRPVATLRGEELLFNVYFVWGNNQRSGWVGWGESISLEEWPGEICFSVSCKALLQFAFCFSQNANSIHWLLWPFISPVITVVMLRKWHLYKRLSVCHVRRLQYSSSEL